MVALVENSKIAGMTDISIIWYPLLYRTTPIFSKNGDWKLGHKSYLPVVAPCDIMYTYMLYCVI